MFLNLPNTPEVQKAKYELGQMMEDKYRELIADGKDRERSHRNRDRRVWQSG